MIKKVLDKIYTKNGRIIISIILGIGLASIFRKVCKDMECYSYKAPPIKEVEDKIFSFNDKCYKYRQNNISCGKKEQQVVV